MKNKISGIYEIKNTKTGKKYIGSSNHVNSRIKGHKNKLRKDKHSNTHLQNSWNKYGGKYFQFRIAKLCKEKELKKVEQEFLDRALVDGWDKYYNIAKDSKAPLRGVKFSKEHRRKISQARIGMEFTEEHRENMSLSQKNYLKENKHQRLGYITSDKSKKAQSEARYRYYEANEAYWTGKKRRKSTVLKIAKKKRLLSDEDAFEVLDLYNNTDSTYQELGDKFGVSGDLIGSIVRGDVYPDIYQNYYEDKTNSKTADQAYRRVKQKRTEMSIDQVLWVIVLREKENLMYKELAEHLPVTLAGVGQILRKETWSDAWEIYNTWRNE